MARFHVTSNQSKNYIRLRSFKRIFDSLIYRLIFYNRSTKSGKKIYGLENQSFWQEVISFERLFLSSIMVLEVLIFIPCLYSSSLLCMLSYFSQKNSHRFLFISLCVQLVQCAHSYLLDFLFKYFNWISLRLDFCFFVCYFLLFS